MKTKEDENKKDLEGADEKGGCDTSLSRDLQIIAEDIEQRWIHEIHEITGIDSSNSANEVYYAKKVDNHIEVGIAKIEFIR